jgi:hypothetical protein
MTMGTATPKNPEETDADTAHAPIAFPKALTPWTCESFLAVIFARLPP